MTAQGLTASFFYNDNDPVLPESFKKLLRRKLKGSDEELVKHVRTIRDKAWEVVNYPCIGHYLFLDISITLHPIYAQVIERVKSGQHLLDIGVGMGENLRQLVVDGAPSQNLHGCDLQSSFFGLGAEMFGDKDDFKPTLTACDFLAPNGATGLKNGSYDIIHAADFFPLFTYDQQVLAASRMLQLLKQKPGSMIFGRNIVAFDEPIEVPAKLDPHGQGHYVHTSDSFMKMLIDVEEQTGISFKRGAEVYTYRRNPIRPGGWERRLRYWMIIDEVSGSKL